MDIVWLGLSSLPLSNKRLLVCDSLPVGVWRKKYMVIVNRWVMKPGNHPSLISGFLASVMINPCI